MAMPPFAARMLELEVRSMLTRLARVRPFALQESMLPAANLLPQSQVVIEEYLMSGRRHLRGLLHEFATWLQSREAMATSAEEGQRRFAFLRIRFNTVLTQFDMFSDVITQRSENETGVWLSGLDVASADALRLSTRVFEAPAVLCYLDRGVGAAIRRARTRMPGGGVSPVAIVKVPRERMVGSGIASSLFHEVGHQAAALLGLVESIRPVLRAHGERDRANAAAWQLWDRWISEVVADLWSVARVGVASTMGLMGVVSLPKAFVFRVNADDPHPAPWIRVKLSAAIGSALYPQPMWGQLADLWDSFYPLTGAAPGQRDVLDMLERTIPTLVSTLLEHRPPALQGRSLVEALDLADLQPAALRDALQRWRRQPQGMYDARPIVAFAVLGQGRADGEISPEEESTVLGKLLTHWALRSTLEAAGRTGVPHQCGCRSRGRHGQQIPTTRRTSWQIQ
jgi:hypothetical protein